MLDALPSATDLIAGRCYLLERSGKHGEIVRSVWSNGPRHRQAIMLGGILARHDHTLARKAR